MNILGIGVMVMVIHCMLKAQQQDRNRVSQKVTITSPFTSLTNKLISPSVFLMYFNSTLISGYYKISSPHL